MVDEAIRKKILDFLKENLLGVVSTIHTNNTSPESAVVAFVETEKLEIVFGTSNNSRKYQNILKNNRVCFVIGWSAAGTIQYEGKAQELSKEQSKTYAILQAKKNPESAKFADREDQRYFIVRPTWIRFLNSKKTPPETYEISF